MLMKPFIVSRFYYLIIFEVLIGLIYLLILWLLKMDWLRKIPEKILLNTDFRRALTVILG